MDEQKEKETPEEKNDDHTAENVEVEPAKHEEHIEAKQKEQHPEVAQQQEKRKRIYKRVRCELCDKEMIETSFTKHYNSCKIKQAKPKIEVRPIRREKVEIVPEQTPQPQEPIIETLTSDLWSPSPPPEHIPLESENHRPPCDHRSPTPPPRAPEPIPLTRTQKLSLLARKGLP